MQRGGGGASENTAVSGLGSSAAVEGVAASGAGGAGAVALRALDDAYFSALAEKIVGAGADDDEIEVVTDLISFYHLPSSVIGHSRHTHLYAGYLYYYVTDTVPFAQLVEDALILARNVGIDVFNCLDLMQNQDVIQLHKFQQGDGNLCGIERCGRPAPRLFSYPPPKPPPLPPTTRAQAILCLQLEVSADDGEGCRARAALKGLEVSADDGEGCRARGTRAALKGKQLMSHRSDHTASSVNHASLMSAAPAVPA